MTAVSLPMLLGLGWALSAALVFVGRVRHSGSLLGAGELLLGLMLVVTVEAYYLYEAYRNGGALLLHPEEILALGFVGLASGLVVMLGLETAWSGASPSRSRARVPAAPPAKR